jgi:hypothetical protein
MNMDEALLRVQLVYLGSNGDETKALYAELEAIGPAGFIAANLFRASKCSARAKVYRGGQRGKGSYRRMAYDRKQWAIDNLCDALAKHAAEIGPVWGWGDDPKEPVHSAVLYIDLPQGQISFHTYPGSMGPKYKRPWDGVRGMSETRIVHYVAQVLSGEEFRDGATVAGSADRTNGHEPDRKTSSDGGNPLSGVTSGRDAGTSTFEHEQIAMAL